MASIGARSTPSNGESGQDRPVLFQKYFKAGHRTYACQIKLANNGKRYLVVTEGYRDPETDEIKKHYVRVFDHDLKEFFSMLQETVLYLRANKDVNAATIAGMVAPKPEATAPTKPTSSARAAKAPPAKPLPARKPLVTVAKPAAPQNGKNGRKPTPTRGSR